LARLYDATGLNPTRRAKYTMNVTNTTVGTSHSNRRTMNLSTRTPA
jgi:hypothetical protein